MIGLVIIFGMFSAAYHWFPKIFGRYINEPMGYIHFWISIIGGYLVFFPSHYEGLAGMPRRYIDYRDWTGYYQFGNLNRFICCAAVALFAAQLLFVFNFFYSAFKGRKINT
jgi:cytochrome c oxidase subunit 1